MDFEIEKEKFDVIVKVIYSVISLVGIDVKKMYVIILEKFL